MPPQNFSAALWQQILAAAESMRRGAGRDLLVVDAERQELLLVRSGRPIRHYPVSTSRHGLGCRENSLRTPTGWHRVAEKIGAGCAAGEVFEGRRPQGWRASERDPAGTQGVDRITSRILWLEGLEPGHNLGPGRDSRARYIYIHGTPEAASIGHPASIGCIRMRDRDVIDLFDRVTQGTPVYIHPRPRGAPAADTAPALD